MVGNRHKFKLFKLSYLSWSGKCIMEKCIMAYVKLLIYTVNMKTCLCEARPIA